MDISKILFPVSGVLVKNEESYVAQIVDEDLDPINCEFNFDKCVLMHLKNYTHIVLSLNTLYRLIELVEESEELYKEDFKNEEL